MKTPSSSERSDTRRGIVARAGSPSGLALAVLCAITLAFYHGLWSPGLVLIKRDAFRHFLPIKQYLIERLSAGDVPQWFPYEALGRPFISATATGVVHPFTTLYFLLPVPDAYRASTLISCLLAALGPFVLGRTLGFSRAGAFVAGVAFALSGYVVSLTENVLYLYSICVLPFFCAALEKALAAHRAWVVAPAVIWASVFLQGDVQTGYYYGFVTLVWLAARTRVSYGETGLRLALAGGLAALLAGIQLGPTWVAFAGSDRTQPAMFHEYALQWSTHPLRLVTLVLSPGYQKEAFSSAVNAFLDAQPVAPEILGGQWAESLYLGVPVMGLALLGTWHRRDLRVLAWLGGAAGLLALGRFGGLYDLFYHVVPFWSAFRYPEKLMGVASFAVAMLAGAGFDDLRAGHGPLAPWLVLAILSVGAGLGLRTDSEALSRSIAGAAGYACLYSAVTAFGVWVITLAFRKKVLREPVFVIFLGALITFDLTSANSGSYYTGPVRASTFTPAFVKTLGSLEDPLGPGRFRLVSAAEEDIIWPEHLQRQHGYFGAVSIARRQALALSHNAEFHIEALLPYLPGYSGVLAALLQEKPSMELEARFNVAYYIGRRYYLSDARLAQVLVSELPNFDLALFRNPFPAKPRSYLSRQPERAIAPVAPAALLTRPDFLNGEVDLIETQAPLPGPSLSGQAVIERYAPEEVDVRVETPQPAVLILLDAYDKGWTAKLESGLELPILRANALVRAVVIPAGTHLVTFSYQTPLLKTGAAASLAGCLLCLGLITHAWWRRRHPTGPCP